MQTGKLAEQVGIHKFLYLACKHRTHNVCYQLYNNHHKNQCLLYDAE